ncbi:hypothetical protein ACMYR3_00505 [Ampullimonas aquatilis]
MIRGKQIVLVVFSLLALALLKSNDIKSDAPANQQNLNPLHFLTFASTR